MRGYPGTGAAHWTEASPQLDRRRSQRVTARFRATVSAKARLFWTRHKAYIVEYSMLGLRVQVEAALSLGQVVRIASETSPDRPAVCSVVWVGRAGSPREGEAGLAFLDLVS